MENEQRLSNDIEACRIPLSSRFMEIAFDCSSWNWSCSADGYPPGCSYSLIINWFCNSQASDLWNVPYGSKCLTLGILSVQSGSVRRSQLPHLVTHASCLTWVMPSRWNSKVDSKHPLGAMVCHGQIFQRRTALSPTAWCLFWGKDYFRLVWEPMWAPQYSTKIKLCHSKNRLPWHRIEPSPIK